MKNIKILIVLFTLTLVLGGINFVSAAYYSEPLDWLTADFLGNPNYTSDYEKKTWSGQQVQVVKTTGDREVQLAEFTHTGEGVSPYIWMVFKTGTTKDWDSNSFQIPTSYSEKKYKIGAKLALPWIQTKIEKGTWVIDK